MSAPRVPVLTYHAMHVSGNAYEDNDHAALSRDLDTIAGLGFRICALSDVVSAVERDALESLAGCVALTFDDGSDFDFHDLHHPVCGEQRSMFSILEKARATGRHPTIEATTFAIVSPDARRELDRTCMIGAQWWNDDWWAAAEGSGLLRIENHSWDHNHESLRRTEATCPRGTFRLERRDEADAEIRDANDYLLTTRMRAGPALFAYPYGEASEFLAREYFPRGTDVHGIRAAFTTDGIPITRRADRWCLPRYVFRSHWDTEAELRRILRECRPE